MALWSAQSAWFFQPDVVPHATTAVVLWLGWPDQERFIRRKSRASIILGHSLDCSTCWALDGDIPVTGVAHVIGAIGAGNERGVRRAMNTGSGSGHPSIIPSLVPGPLNNPRVKNVRKPTNRRLFHRHQRKNDGRAG